MAFKNITQYSAQAGSANTTSLLYAVIGGNTDTSLPLSVLVNNLGLTGVPTTPTAVVGTNTTQISSTAFVQAAVSGGTYAGSFTTLTASSTVSGAGFTTLLAPYAPLASPTFTGTVTIPTGASIAGYALLASPTFTGTPAAPTATAGTNTTQLATTAYAQTMVTGGANAASFTTIAASSTITPSQTAGIVGTTTNNNANAGSWGEYVTATGSAGLSFTNATPLSLTSISLTAGDWDVTGGASFTLSAGGTAVLAAVSTTVNNNPGGFQTNGMTVGGSGVVIGSTTITAPLWRFSLSATTTVYLNAQTNFASGTATGQGFIRARRVR